MYFFFSGTKHQFTAETLLGPEFAAGWTSRKTKRFRGKAEAVKQRVKTTARDIENNYFRLAQAQPRGKGQPHDVPDRIILQSSCFFSGVVATLANIVAQIEAALQKQLSSGGHAPQWKEELTAALDKLAETLEDENNVSAYELHSSGIIQVSYFLNVPFVHKAQDLICYRSC